MYACVPSCFLRLLRHRRRAYGASGDQASAEPPIDMSTHEHSVVIKFSNARRHQHRDQAPAEAPIGRSTHEHSKPEFRFSNALTGDRLDGAELQLDLTLPVAATRGRIASFLQAKQVLLMDEGGNVLNDDDVLFELRLSHVQVVIRNQRMSIEKLRGLGSHDPNSSRKRRHRLRVELPRVSPEFRVEMNDAHLDDGLVHVFLAGPEGTLYEDTDCELLMQFPDNYPHSPPEAWFVTEIDHWSVTPAGKVLLDVLSDAWSPALTTDAILQSITSLLAEPSP